MFKIQDCVITLIYAHLDNKNVHLMCAKNWNMKYLRCVEIDHESEACGNVLFKLELE